MYHQLTNDCLNTFNVYLFLNQRIPLIIKKKFDILKTTIHRSSINKLHINHNKFFCEQTLTDKRYDIRDVVCQHLNTVVNKTNIFL